MKKLILAAVAASVVAAPAMAAPSGRYDTHRVEQSHRGDARTNTRQVVRTRQVVQTRQVQIRQVQARQGQYRQGQYRSWNRGDRFDNRYAANYRVISNPRAYRLHDAPRGYRWVQSGNDAVMVAITSGIIGAVLANIF
jgi:Ni/Co efflux regulator RcnB